MYHIINVRSYSSTLQLKVVRPLTKRGDESKTILAVCNIKITMYM